MCFFHLKKAIEPLVSSVRVDQRRHAGALDVRALHLADEAELRVSYSIIIELRLLTSSPLFQLTNQKQHNTRQKKRAKWTKRSW